MMQTAAFNTVFRFRAHEHFVEDVRAAAAQRLLTPSEFVRAAIRERLNKDGIPVGAVENCKSE